MRPRVVILGTGWAGNKLARRLDKSKFDVRLISPANHFLFTSLLPATAVGTLEFRAIQEPVRTIPGLAEYYQAKATDVDLARRVVRCEDVWAARDDKNTFEVKYDALVVAAGCKTHTFGTPGVAELEAKDDAAVFYLKHLHHARKIRNRLLECFERASNPTLGQDEVKRLLTFVVVGGGPTSCEFAAELVDFLREDVSRWFPDLSQRARVVLVEAGPRVLGSFDAALVQYYDAELRRRGVEVRTGTAVRGLAEEVRQRGGSGHVAHLGDGTSLPFGLLVWSAGLAPVKLVAVGLPNSFAKDRGGRLIVDPFLRVPGGGGRVFAAGDCAACGYTSDGGGGLAGRALPPTASVAEQQAQYLADCFNDSYSLHAAVLLAQPPEDQSDAAAPRWTGSARTGAGASAAAAGAADTRPGLSSHEAARLASGGGRRLLPEPLGAMLLPEPSPVYPGAMPFDFAPFSWLNRLYDPSPAFRYVSRGSMASLGQRQGVCDLTASELPGAPQVALGTGPVSSAFALAAWRGTYTFKQLSWANTCLVPMYWFKAWLFGRDISRF